jgi:hypothetical protein
MRLIGEFASAALAIVGGLIALTIAIRAHWSLRWKIVCTIFAIVVSLFSLFFKGVNKKGVDDVLGEYLVSSICQNYNFGWCPPSSIAESIKGDRTLGSESSAANRNRIEGVWEPPVTITSSDPIGSLTKTGTFSGSINLGRTSKGDMICFYREEGDSHRLDIGIGALAAFVRLDEVETFNRAPMPIPPLRLFAGDRMPDQNNKVTGEYFPNVSYNDPVEYVRFHTGFAVIVRRRAKAFFEWVARAQKQFIVVQSIEYTKSNDVVAVYHFDLSAISPLLSCAKTHLGGTAPL